VLDFAFGPMGLQRVEAKVLTDNARSMRLLERAGFDREALLSESGEDEHSQSVDEFLFGMERVRPDG
jgi:RimJ/RimL family protein N-acetyltransferase